MKQLLVTYFLLSSFFSFSQNQDCTQLYDQTVEACFAGTTTLKPKASRLNVKADYTWTLPNGKVLKSEKIELSNLGDSDSGIYKLVASYQDGCKNQDSSYVKLIIQKEAIYLGLQPPIPFCEGNSVQLPYISDLRFYDKSNITTYKWTGPQNFSSNLNSPKIENFTKEKSGKYTLEVSVKGKCLLHSKVEFNIKPVSQMVVSIGNTTANSCSNDPVILSALSFNEPKYNSYSWRGPDNFRGDSQSITVNNFSNNKEGIYTLEVKTQGCEKLATVNKEVKYRKSENKLKITTYQGSQFCEGSNFNIYTLINDSWPNGNEKISWTGPNNFKSNGRSIKIQNFNKSLEGIYYASIQENNCSSLLVKDSIFISISRIPQLVIGDTLFVRTGCSLKTNVGTYPTYKPSPVVFASLNNLKVEYEWSGPNNFKSNLEYLELKNFKKSQEGEYIIKVNFLEGCKGTIQKKVVVKQDTSSITWKKEQLCNGLVLFSPNYSNLPNFTEHVFFNSKNEIVKNPIDPKLGTEYTVKTTSYGDCKISWTQKIDTKNIAAFTLKLPETIESCVGKNIGFNQIYPGGALWRSGFTNSSLMKENLMYSNSNWIFNIEKIGDIVTESNKQLMNLSKSDEGIYKIRGELSGDCTGTYEAQTQLFVDGEKPISNFKISQDKQTLFFENNSTGRISNYFWDFGNNQKSTKAIPDPIIFDKDGDYLVSLEVSNGCGTNTYSENVAISKILVLGPEIPGFLSNFKLYPNPSLGLVTLENLNHKNLIASISDLNGKLISSFEINSDEISKSLDLNILPSNTYLIKTIDEKGFVEVKKILLIK